MIIASLPGQVDKLDRQAGDGEHERVRAFVPGLIKTVLALWPMRPQWASQRRRRSPVGEKSSWGLREGGGGRGGELLRRRRRMRKSKARNSEEEEEYWDSHRLK